MIYEIIWTENGEQLSVHGTDLDAIERLAKAARDAGFTDVEIKPMSKAVAL